MVLQKDLQLIELFENSNFAEKIKFSNDKRKEWKELLFSVSKILEIPLQDFEFGKKTYKELEKPNEKYKERFYCYEKFKDNLCLNIKKISFKELYANIISSKGNKDNPINVIFSKICDFRKELKKDLEIFNEVKQNVKFWINFYYGCQLEDFEYLHRHLNIFYKNLTDLNETQKDFKILFVNTDEIVYIGNISKDLLKDMNCDYEIDEQFADSGVYFSFYEYVFFKYNKTITKGMKIHTLE